MSDDIKAIVQVGDTLNTVKNEYEVLRYLGEGLTAIVYEARQKETGMLVVLKILRPEASTLSVRNFWGEADVIDEMIRAGIICIPKVLDRNRGTTPEFLVMDLISSKEFPSLPVVLEKNGPLPELEALEWAEQAFGLLDKLHTQVERTYTDMQLKNFCWNSGNKVLKVMDWNHVSFPRLVLEKGLENQSPEVLQQLRGRGARNFDDLVRLDLCRLSSYFYTILTGKAAREQGETVWRLERRAGGQWMSISFATRQIILRVLAPSILLGRLSSAQEILAEINFAKTLLNNVNTEGLQNQFDEYMEKVESLPWRKRYGYLHKAEILLDRLSTLAQSDPSLARWCRAQNKRFEDMQPKQSPEWKTGQSFYNMASFGEAYKYWSTYLLTGEKPQGGEEKQALDDLNDEAKSLGRVDLWRWAMIARICSDTFQSIKREDLKQYVRESLEQGIQTLHEGNLGDADVKFGNASASIQHPFLSLWQQEINILQDLDEFIKERNTNPAKALELCQKVIEQDVIKLLPYKDFFVTDPIWLSRIQNLASTEDVEKMRDTGSPGLGEILGNWVNVLKNQFVDAGTDLGLVDKVESAKVDFEKYCDALKDVLFKVPDNSKVIKNAMEYAKQRVDPREAFAIYEILMSWGFLDDSQQQEIKLARIAIVKRWFESATQTIQSAIDEKRLLATLPALETAQYLNEVLAMWGVPDDGRISKINHFSGAIGDAEKIRSERLREVAIYTAVLEVENELKDVGRTLRTIANELDSFTEAGRTVASEKLASLPETLEKLRQKIGPLPQNAKDASFKILQGFEHDHTYLSKLNKAISPELIQKFANAKQQFELYKKRHDPVDLKRSRELLDSVIQQWHQIQKTIQNPGA